MDIDFLIPEFHRSIQDSLNNIYLIGGSYKNEKSKQIFKFNNVRNTLIEVANMKNPRSSHSLCFIKPNIYIIGTFKIINNLKVDSQMEEDFCKAAKYLIQKHLK
jgi:hypothetical protein